MHQVNRTQAPSVELPKSFDIPNPQLVTSKLGIPIYYFPTASEPIVRLDFIFEAGSRYQDKVFVASAANALLIEGTHTFTGAELAEAIDFLGSYIYPFIDRDEAGITAFCLKRNFSKTLQLVLDVISEPVFPIKEFENFVANKEQSIILDLQRSDSVARKRFMEHIFGSEHPYGIHGGVEDLRRLATDDLIEFHKKYYHSDNLRIILTCDSDPSHFDILEQELAVWSMDNGQKLPDQGIHPAIPQYPVNSYFSVPHATQVSLRMGKLIPGPQHPDYHKITILNTILGGYFGSRLMQNIREDKGLTYGIGSSLIAFKELSLLSIGSNVSKERYQEAIVECFNEINRLRTELVSEDELSRIKNYLIGDLQRQLDGPFSRTDAFKGLLLHGLNFTVFSDFYSELIGISPEQIRDTAVKYFNEGDFMVISAGPE